MPTNSRKFTVTHPTELFVGLLLYQQYYGLMALLCFFAHDQSLSGLLPLNTSLASSQRFKEIRDIDLLATMFVVLR